MEQQPPQEQYHQWADQLEAILASESQGREYSHVRWVIEDLRAGDLHAAQVNYRNQGDKYSNLPNTKKFLQEIGLAGR